MTATHSTHASGRAHYLLSIASICIVLLGIFLVFVSASRRESDWYSVHMANGRVYFGHLQSVDGMKMMFSNPYRFEASKTAPVTTASTTFSIQPIQNWYSIIPVSSADAVTLAEDGNIIIDQEEALFWGPLDRDAELTQALIKANEGK